FLSQRPPRGRWAGMWEFPHGPLQEGESYETAAARLVPALTGLEAQLGPELLTVRHGVTRFRIRMVCLEARYLGGTVASPVYQQGRWVLPGRLSEFPVSVPQRRLARALSGIQQTQLF